MTGSRLRSPRTEQRPRSLTKTLGQARAITVKRSPVDNTFAETLGHTLRSEMCNHWRRSGCVERMHSSLQVEALAQFIAGCSALDGSERECSPDIASNLITEGRKSPVSADQRLIHSDRMGLICRVCGQTAITMLYRQKSTLSPANCDVSHVDPTQKIRLRGPTRTASAYATC